jgi:hypothetical protein
LAETSGWLRKLGKKVRLSMPPNIQSFGIVLACLLITSQAYQGPDATETLAELLLAVQPAVGIRPTNAGSRVRLAGAAVGPSMSEPLAIGTAFPSVELDYGFPPEKVNLADRVKGKRVIVVGLPGAFTPT